ncbi:hypothetical protein OC846_003798 [Tilletia horrida]|uniref:DUF2428 domain-containing protein n=1 Tax=Tilletia horrida TaxID=155126 RepID=A0AAN6GNE7_9BASI|nr:hypothetical protein OC846_003798 [Tilletia horrida]KAK0565123.1 hypothetical protein OC861_003919 [Tilletia horrida]
MAEDLDGSHGQGQKSAGRDTSEQGLLALLADSYRTAGSRESIDFLASWCKTVSVCERKNLKQGQDPRPLEASTLSHLAFILTAGFNSDVPTIQQKSQTALRSILDFDTFKNGRAEQRDGIGQFPMAADLLTPALQTPQLKRSMLVLEVYIDIFRTKCLGSLQAKESLFQAMASGLDNVDGLSRRRAAVMLAMLKASISKKDYSWCPTLAHILCRSGEVSRTQVREYVLPSLFSLDADAFHHLGDAVMQLPGSENSQSSIKALLTIWKAASQHGLCHLVGTIDEEAGISRESASGSYIATISASLLEDCLLSRDDEISSGALAVLSTSKSISAPLSATDLRLWVRYITANISATDPGIRSRILALFTKLLTRLRTSTYAMAREKGKTRSEEQGRSRAECVDQEAARVFLENLIRILCRNLWPGSPYPAMLSALRLLELLLSSDIDPTFGQELQEHADDSVQSDNSKALRKSLRSHPQPWTFHISIVDATLVKTLFGCFRSTFGDIRDLAKDILIRCPAPFPGLDAAGEEELLTSGRRLLLSARASQAEAGITMLQLHSHLASKRSPNGANDFDSRSALLKDLLDLAFAQVAFAKRDGVASAAAAYPVHGCLWALGRLLQDAQASPFPREDQAAKALFGRTLQLVAQVWSVVQPILCSQTAADASNDNNDEAGDSVLPDLELARAISLAGGENPSASKESESGVFQHQLLLSYGWRSIKETASLLSALVQASLRMAPNFLDENTVNSIGLQYLEWMTTIRHRGAFSVVYPEFSTVASACLGSNRQELKKLPQTWLQQLISDICARDHSFSTTRRSAGLSYAVLGLLQAIQAVDSVSPTESVLALIREADRLDEDSLPGDLSRQVHLFNIIRLLVLDSRVGSKLVPMTTQLLRLAVSRFQSDSWDLSNVAMLLFSATVNRVFSSRQQHNKDENMAKPSFATFFKSHPGLSDFFLEQLKRLHADATVSNVSNGALFTLLAFVTKLQASKVNEEDAIRLRMRSILAGRSHGHNLLKEVSAKAYASTVTPQEALPLAMSELREAVKSVTPDASLIRAKHLALLTDEDSQDRQEEQNSNWLAILLSTSVELLEDTSTISDSTVAAICELLRMTGLLNQDTNQGSATADGVRAICANMVPVLRRVIFDASGGRQASRTRLASATMTLLDLVSVSGGDDAVSSTVLSLLRHTNDAVRTHALEYLRAEVRTHSPSVVNTLDRIASNKALGWSERQSAVATLVQQNFRNQWHRHLGEQEREDLRARLETVLWEAWETSCVPLRESLLVYLSHLLRSLLLSVSADGTKTTVRALAPSVAMFATLVRHASDEIESLDARLSAARSLQALDCMLYDETFVHRICPIDDLAAAFLQLQLAVLRLADDDDEDVREIASYSLANVPSISGRPMTAAASAFDEHFDTLAGSVRSQGFNPQVSKQRALEWLHHCYASAHATEFIVKVWKQHLWSQLLPKDNIIESSFKNAFESKLALFAVDAPNQYRNDAENALLYAKSLRRFRDLSLLGEDRNRLEAFLLRFDGVLKHSPAAAEASQGGARYMLGLRLASAAQVMEKQGLPLGGSARACAQHISDNLLLRYALAEDFVD